MNWKVYR